MVRTIKFRGRRIDNGEWVYGDMLHISGGCMIYFGSDTDTAEPDIDNDSNVAVELFNEEVAVIIPDTVGQFTGLVDKNGKEIYEGDIIKLMEFPDAPIYEVKWSNDSLAFCVESLPYAPAYNDWGTPVGSNLLWALENASDIEIIGNLYDNPELLKGGKSC